MGTTSPDSIYYADDSTAYDVPAAMAAMANSVQTALNGTAWTAYTPVLTASTTNPSIGSTGVKEGAYKKMGKTVFWRCSFVTGGTGISAGSGVYTVSLPLPVVQGYATIMGQGWLYTGGTFKTVVCDGSPLRMIRNSNGLVVDHAVGFTAGSEVLALSGTYQTT